MKDADPLPPSPAEFERLRALDRDGWLRECARRGVRIMRPGVVVTDAGENTAAFRRALAEKGGMAENLLAILKSVPAGTFTRT